MQRIVYNNANINLCDYKGASSLLKICPGDHDNTWFYLRKMRIWNREQRQDKNVFILLGFFSGRKSTVEGLLRSQLAYM